MTISSRTRIFRICWILAILFAAVGILASLRMGKGLVDAAERLPGLQSIDGGARTGSDIVSGWHPLIAAALCSVYGIVVLSLLSFRYSRTISMELFFFAFWALALAAEPLRMESLRGVVDSASFPERNIVTRVILSARFLGIISLFAGSLYASGFNSEKPGTALSVILLCSAVLGMGLPINTGSFGPDLLQRIGYGELYLFFSIACFIGVCANYLLAARITGEKGYRVAALGCALAFGGGLMLRQSASLKSILAGAALLLLGTVLFVRKIHTYYLWQ